ncbi:uncharacterized protein LOC132743619 [Ruditapes philippinarum]|uniref:uncharacterized protein LOC132743619 n=1 Tax=Ruditapes philippinarum TaxID=129788 RepID=UPI00295AE446|nr:uncharacterized protein LOC132743619 [Ruditapes philippinarum]
MDNIARSFKMKTRFARLIRLLFRLVCVGLLLLCVVNLVTFVQDRFRSRYNVQLRSNISGQGRLVNNHNILQEHPYSNKPLEKPNIQQSENPSLYLQSDRFDLIFKMVYAYFYVFKKHVPQAIEYAYTEHIRVWNDFKEYCSDQNKSWFDMKFSCKDKMNKFDFMSSFHKTIDTTKEKGFNSSLSRIPIDKNGFLLNGAHRIATSIILSQNASFEHFDYSRRFKWGYEFFQNLKLSETRIMNMAMLEWMKIQINLPELMSPVSIVSVFSNNELKDKEMRNIVREKCSRDNGILYEQRINIGQNGARELFTHMYGQQPWLDVKIKQMQSKFTKYFSALFLFVYARDSKDLVQCKTEIRNLYNDKIFKSTAHIPDNLEENLILAEMILNPNSVQFMNDAKDASDCKLIATEIASRTSQVSIKTLPGIYLGREDVMVDSGTVLGFFGLRKRTDVDLLFSNEIDMSILGNKNGMSIQVHAFKNNSISNERPWGEDHFKVSGVKDKWDLFYDPDNYGYCYGIKFVSLKQLIRYKTVRNEPNKDMRDVELINNFLNTTKS